MALFSADLPNCGFLADARNDTGKFKCQVTKVTKTKVTNADGRNQNVSRKDAKAQRDSLVFLP
jgi:hypothetical protein